jgi:hypothetical protein
VTLQLVFQCHADVHGGECVAENAPCDFLHEDLFAEIFIC